MKCGWDLSNATGVGWGHGNEPSRQGTVSEEKAQCRVRVLKEFKKVARKGRQAGEGGAKESSRGMGGKGLALPFLMLCVGNQVPALSGPPGLSVWSVLV